MFGKCNQIHHFKIAQMKMVEHTCTYHQPPPPQKKKNTYSNCFNMLNIQNLYVYKLWQVPVGHPQSSIQTDQHVLVRSTL